MPSTETVRKGLAWASVGFGAAGLLAPAALARAYGIEQNAEARFVLREWGNRNLVIGYLSLQASSPKERLAVNSACAAMNALDTVVSAGSAELPGGFRARAALTSGVFAGVCAWLVVNGS